MSKMNPVAIDSFLKLGYFIDYDADRCPIDFSRIDKAPYLSMTRDELIRIGVAKLRESFETLWERGRENVVPLSGGLDSRLVLAAVLEHCDASQLSTYTFGVPGSYDYEIGSLVAKVAGTKHCTYPINAITYHEDELIEVALREDCQTILFYNAPLWELIKKCAGTVIWSGYVGDAVAGNHLHNPPSVTLEEAKRKYLINRTFVRSVKLNRGNDEDLLPFVSGGSLKADLLTWDEQVLFDDGIRKFTVSHVLWKGFEYRTPLINTPWMDFMFSVPKEHRLGERLMIEVGCRAFPKLFDLPCKNRLGHVFNTPDAVVKATFWMNRVRKLAHQFAPWVNYPSVLYNDFNEGIRLSPDLRGIVRSSIEDLRKRGICDWVDFDSIWRRHDRRIRNHGDALIVLASLELVLKAREMESREKSAKAEALP
jgi:hypothetical protein